MQVETTPNPQWTEEVRLSEEPRRRVQFAQGISPLARRDVEHLETLEGSGEIDRRIGASRTEQGLKKKKMVSGKSCCCCRLEAETSRGLLLLNDLTGGDPGWDPALRTNGPMEEGLAVDLKPLRAIAYRRVDRAHDSTYSLGFHSDAARRLWYEQECKRIES